MRMPPSRLKEIQNNEPIVTQAIQNKMKLFFEISSSTWRVMKCNPSRLRTRCQGVSCKREYVTKTHKYPLLRFSTEQPNMPAKVKLPSNKLRIEEKIKKTIRIIIILSVRLNEFRLKGIRMYDLS